jgi:predicted AAA+ superfamily ATPase
MELFRKIEPTLTAWKNRPGHLPAIVFGARQVGKTYSLLQFARTAYETHVYVSLEVDGHIVREIERDMRPRSILKALEDYRRTKIEPGRTLVILDEVQNCEQALTALKYFAEECPDIDIIAAGSLLGVAVNRGHHSFPVGKVEMFEMFPMDMEEYLLARGKSEQVSRIHEAFEGKEALPSFLHDELMDDFKDYLQCGGMPAVVQSRLDGQDIRRSMEVARGIVTQYLADMTKYCGSADSVKIRMAYDSIPTQLAKDNTKFQFNVARKGGSASYFGGAIDWLKASGTILLCRRIEHGFFPPSRQMDLSSFKIYMSDVGLLSARTEALPDSFHPGGRNVSGFKGDLTENYVAAALRGNGHELFYWESEGKAEVDFVIAKEGATIPIEVKAASNRKSKSLKVFVSKYDPPYAIRVSGRNFGFEDGFVGLPLYAVFLI